VVQGVENLRLMHIERSRLFGKMIKGDLDSIPDTKYMQIYENLGGSEESIVGDMTQTALMWKLRVKIDVWSRGLDESLRQRNRELLIEAYLRLPPRRVWHFVKHIRFAFLSKKPRLGAEDESYDPSDPLVQGPEDTIAQACHIIRPEKVAQLMYKATINDSKMKQRPGLNLWADMSLDLNGLKQIMALKMFAFDGPGSIHDCGVYEIEQLAQNKRLKILQGGRSYQELGNLILEEDEKIELLTRIMVRSRFMEVLNGKLEKGLLEQLKNVFFEVVYPTPPYDVKA